MLKTITHIFVTSMCSVNRSRYLAVLALCVLPVLFLSLFLFVPPSFAELKPMGESELKSTTAQQGFTQFAMTDNSARLFLDIHMETQATIGGFSGGYYEKDNGTGTLVTAWDQQWSDITLGTTQDGVYTDDLTIDGLVFIADFDDTNTLHRVVIGSNRLQGDVSADFTSFSGIYADALVTASLGDNPTLNRGALGPTTFQFQSEEYKQNMGMFFILNMDGPQPGVQVVAGFDENSLGTDPWWNSP